MANYMKYEYEIVYLLNNNREFRIKKAIKKDNEEEKLGLLVELNLNVMDEISKNSFITVYQEDTCLSIRSSEISTFTVTLTEENLVF